MKMRSLKAMAVLFALAITATSNVFAANFIDRHFGGDSSSGSSRIDARHFNRTPIAPIVRRAQIDLGQINSNLNNLFNMEGTLTRNGVNPFTPGTGVSQFLDSINGTGPRSNGQSLSDFLAIMSQLGVPNFNQLNINPNLITQIGSELTILIGLSESYAFAFNTNAPDQSQIALAWLESAQRLGALFQLAGVDSFVINPVTFQEDNISGLLGTLVVIQSQLVQAFGNSLNGLNNVGAIPGDLASQMNASVILNAQTALLSNTIADLVVRDLARPFNQEEI